MTTAVKPAAVDARIVAELQIEDMHCWECADLLELAIESYPGVVSAPVNEDGSCEVTFRAGVLVVPELLSAIERLGYRVELREIRTREESTDPLEVSQR